MNFCCHWKEQQEIAATSNGILNGIQSTAVMSILYLSSVLKHLHDPIGGKLFAHFFQPIISGKYFRTDDEYRDHCHPAWSRKLSSKTIKILPYFSMLKAVSNHNLFVIS